MAKSAKKAAPKKAKKAVVAKKAPPAKKIVAKPAAKTTAKASGKKDDKKIPAKKPAPIAAKPTVAAKANGKKTELASRASATAAKPQSTKIDRPIPKFLDDLPDTPVQHAAPTPSKADFNSNDLFTEQELAHFLQLLKAEKEKLFEKARHAVETGNIILNKDEMYDEVDLATATIEQNLTFRLLDRDRKLLNEIEHAIAKIQSGEYGYCEGTGELIPKRRLELRPWTRHSVKYKEQLERMKKSGRGVVDEDEVT